MQPVPAPPADDATVIQGTGTVSVPASTDHAVNDTITVRLVVALIGVVVLGAMGCLTAMALTGMTVDVAIATGLMAIATTGVGGLVGLLASTASRRT